MINITNDAIVQKSQLRLKILRIAWLWVKMVSYIKITSQLLIEIAIPMYTNIANQTNIDLSPFGSYFEYFCKDPATEIFYCSSKDSVECKHLDISSCIFIGKLSNNALFGQLGKFK